MFILLNYLLSSLECFLGAPIWWNRVWYLGLVKRKSTVCVATIWQPSHRSLTNMRAFCLRSRIFGLRTQIKLVDCFLLKMYPIKGGILMALSYNKLWKLLIDKGMNKTDLKNITGLSQSTIAKLTNGENVNTDILERICEALGCELEDIVEIDKRGEK